MQAESNGMRTKENTMMEKFDLIILGSGSAAAVPHAVFTIPQVASVGLTKEGRRKRHNLQM